MADKQDSAWAEWELASDRRGVRLETRKNRDTGLLQTRVAGIVNCSSEELWKTLTTPDLYREVMPRTLESVHLDEKPRRKQLHCYQRLAGGPSSDRDYTLLVKWKEEKTPHGRSYHRTWSVENDAGPEPKDGVVRVEVNDGAWTLTPREDGGTDFEQISYIELGGSLWAMLAKSAVRDSARELVENLKARYPDA